jgi:hypothetical protein
VEHGYTLAEISAATGLPSEQLEPKWEALRSRRPAPRENGRLVIRPYPGGRHPRVGFLDGAIRPQRETKVSVFAPWQDGGYVVVDVPEAIWVDGPDKPELMYLAHTHVPTLWSKQGIELEPLEWQRLPDGSLSVERRLPNQVSFGAKVTAGAGEVRMELWLTNGTNSTLRGLRVQNCVMLKAAPGFEPLTSDNKLVEKPFVACRNAAGDRWVITAWEPCQRAWANPPCPCMHSDPQFPDCQPGQTQRVRGWLWFHEGTDIRQELERRRSTVASGRSADDSRR